MALTGNNYVISGNLAWQISVSKGKSYVVIYEEEFCVAEWKIKHNQEGFNQLKSQLCKETTEIVFEATGVYSKQIESF